MIVVGGAFIIYSIYTLIPHKGWNSNAQPDMDAKIIEFRTENGLPGIGNNNNRTATVTFSDGFYYKSYRYNCPKIGLPNNPAETAMREKAIAAHKEAVLKAK